MRRADRLFRIVQFLRAGRLQTARSLAQKLQVSDRTIYRDVQDLQLSGVPILGEAGVGYTLRRDYDLPPLMFDGREITALVLGSRMVMAWGDAELASAANDALRKIEAVLTPALRDRIDAVRLYAPAFTSRDPNQAANQLSTRDVLEQLRGAIEQHQIVAAIYGNAEEKVTERRLRPMALLFWGNVWTLVAWCELRSDFRSFRADRFRSLQVLPETFTPEHGQSYEDFLARMKRDMSQNPSI
ncbi:helix-turn-helix transcriptional regulator [Acidicapsa ligni]|uniref:helix-turn-helix transcriptional regulator n=1 Tax=Acidicapsa ligni TaxID=542300 RepID=UPI0021DFC286|nr:YafY family protein [Acidicapsa ligni]